MCINYLTVSRQLAFDWFRTPMESGDAWRAEIYQDYLAPFIIHDAHGRRQGRLGSYGFVPKRKLAPGRAMTTMNARAETVAELATYKRAWAESRLCLLPSLAVFEPNWEGGTHVRWAIEMADKSPFAVAGLWRSWEEEDGALSHSFTQLTVNAADDPVMRRWHRPGEEKRSVVVLRPEHYDDWLSCTQPDMARAYLQLFPAELLHAYPAPRAPSGKDSKVPSPPAPIQSELF